MLPSPLSILSHSYRLYRAHLWIFVGYSAWLLFPIAGIYALSFVPDKTWVSYVSLGIFQIAQIIISIWLSVLFIKLTDAFDVKSDKPAPVEPTVDLVAVQKESALLLRPAVRVMVRQFFYVFLGLIALLIPGIVMAIWYGFSEIAVVLDGKTGMDALHFSKSLVKGRLIQVLYRILAGPIVIGVVSSVIIAILFSLIAASTGTDVIQTLTSSNIPAWMDLLQSSFEIFIIPLVAAYMVVLYKELKKNREETRLPTS